MSTSAHLCAGTGAVRQFTAMAAPGSDSAVHRRRKPFTSAVTHAWRRFATAPSRSTTQSKTASTKAQSIPALQNIRFEFEDSRSRINTDLLTRSFGASLRGRTRRVLARLTMGACRPPRPPEFASHCDFVRAPTSLETIQ